MENAFYIYNNNIFKSGKHFFIPGVKATFGRVNSGKVEFCHDLEFNNWGFRDNVPYGKRKDANEIRIAAIGDSFTINLDCNKPWPKVLDTILKENYGERIKVYNLGLAGAGPANWIDLKSTVKRIDPDIILLSMYDGIITRPYIRFFTRYGKRRFYCVYGKLFTYNRPVGICDPRFPNINGNEYERYAVELAAENNKRQTKFNPLTSVASKAVSSLSNTEEKTKGKALLSPLKTYASKAISRINGVEKNIQVMEKIITWAPVTILASFPSLGRMLANSSELDFQDNLLIDFTRQRGLKYLNFMNIFKENKIDTQNIFTISSSHWSERGNNFVAEKFAKELSAVIK